jgi:hypothetical protein
MSGPKCYRYTVDPARLEAERQRRELEHCQQAIAQTRAAWATLPQTLADLQQRYPAEALTLDLIPPAPPADQTLDAVRQYRDTLNRQLTQTRADLHRLGERAAANHSAKTLLAGLSQDPTATLRTAAEVLQTRLDPLPADDRQTEWQRLRQRLNESDQASLPATLIELRDAFLIASGTHQAEALAAELRQQIQRLNQTNRAALQQQLEQEQQVAARHYTQQVIGETLAALGYEVETGFATLFVEGGVAHIQQPDWGDYYVRLRVKPDAGDLNLNVVRVSADRAAPSNEQARRDREMEEQWCAAHRELLHQLEQRGIANQPLIPLSPLGRERYAPYLHHQVERRPFQLVVDDERIWGIGIPGPGDMDRLEQQCAERGVQLGGVSWRG